MPLPAPVNIAIAAAVSVVAITASSFLSPRIDRQREQEQLIFTNTVNKSLPPQYAVFQAGAGIFRGIAINVLWQRASQMKDEGKFFEAMQLADWITTLQPRFPQVWEFNSWNLAYNMSVATQTPEERWTWVRKGIDLLQQKGIPNNPRSLRLYRQLAWIYFHKVGDLLDDMHMYYKTQLAAEWHAFLGPPPDGNRERVAAWFKPIGDAPKTEAELLAKSPDLKPLVDQLKSRGFSLNRDWALGVTIERSAASLNKLYKVPADLLGNRNSTLPDNATPQQMDQLLAFARATGLREFYFMDPTVMLQMMTEVGPFDWRAPGSHAFYWSYVGLLATDEALKARPDPNADQVNTDRITFFALQQMTARGRIVFEPSSQYFNYMPDPRFIEPYEKVFEAVAKNDRETTQDDFNTGRQNFLENAVQLHYFYGDMVTANKYYERLRITFGFKAPDRYVVPIDEFVTGNFKEFVDDPDQGRTFLTTQIRNAFLIGYLNNNPTAAERFIDNARKYHAFYRQAIVEGVNEAKKTEVKPFDDYVRDAAAEIMMSDVSSTEEVVNKSRVWNQMPVSMRTSVWPIVRTVVTAQSEAAGLNMEVAFPIPPGQTNAQQPTAPNRPTPPPSLMRPQ
jgi:hypothetical protein